jgi:hypothetical protein
MLECGEWIRYPFEGKGLRKMLALWPHHYRGPVEFGKYDHHQLTIIKGCALMPIVKGETAWVTWARVWLRAVQADCALHEALAYVMESSELIVEAPRQA